MDIRTVYAPARPVARVFAVALATTILTIAVGSAAHAEAAKSAPKAPAKSAPKAQQKGPQPSSPPAQQAQTAEQPQLIFSPWTKFCLKGQEAGAKQVCFTGKDGRVESGMPVVAAVLIEPEGEQKKNLRVTMPLGMSL
jgi:invasion protein IalB